MRLDGHFCLNRWTVHGMSRGAIQGMAGQKAPDTKETSDPEVQRTDKSGRARPHDRSQPDQLFRLLVESARDYAIFLLDVDGNILTWNEGARRIKGYEDDEIIGRHFSIFYPPQEIRRGKPDYELRVAADEGRMEDEGWRLRRDGSRFWANVIITALRDEHGQLIGFAKITRDLTERRQAEEERIQLLALERAARNEAESTLERIRAIQSVTEAALAHLTLDDLLGALLDKIAELLEVDTVAILLLDEQNPGELVARAARGIEEEVRLGVRIPVGKGFAGRIADQRRPVVLDDVQHADVLNPILREKGIQALLGVPLLVEAEVIGVLHVGSLRHRRFTASDAQFLQIVADRVAMAIDHARLIDVATTARQEAEVAAATVRAQDEFLTVAAHELKTPMTSLRAAAQLLLRRMNRGSKLDPQSLRATVETIDRQTTRLARLVNQLLETVRAQHGRVELRRLKTDVTELVGNLVDQAQTQTDRHRLVLTAPRPVWAFIDGLRFEQVVSNLLDNAVKFSPDGGQIDVELTQPDSESISLTVRDRGLGVPRKHRPHLFERFYQAHVSDHRSSMGLGLFISREIVHAHGGEIRAEFPRDGGTRFVVTLPGGSEEGE